MVPRAGVFLAPLGFIPTLAKESTMIVPLLRKLFARPSQPNSSSSPGKKFQVRPELERLEDRTVMTTSFFQAAGSTFPGINDNPLGPALIVKIGPGGSVTTTNNGTGPYDGIEDTYVGVVNQAGSGTTIRKLTLTSKADIFGFDGDGIQSFTATPPFTYTVPSTAPPAYSVTGYEGPGTFFTNISFSSSTSINSGIVHFDDGLGHGLLPGKQAFFSLEEPPDAININVKISGAAITSTVFFPFRPNYARPSNTVLAWVQFTNAGANITTNFSLALSVPGIGVQILGATVNGVKVASTISSSAGRPTITIHGLLHGQTEAILVRFTYPPTISLDAIRKLVQLLVP